MDKYNIKENLKKAILEGNFSDAKVFMANFSQNEFSDTIYEIADSSKNIIVYTFICSLLLSKELPQYHIIVAKILSNSSVLTTSSSNIPGSYNAALYHVKKALELDPNNISYMESMLFFYRVPDQLITKEEAIKIAQNILKVDPTNKTALLIISDIL